MKKWMNYLMGCLGLLLAAVLALAAPAATTTPQPIGGLGLSRAQQEFNTRVYNLLQENQIDELEQYVQSIPDCPAQGPDGEICTNERTDGFNYIWHVRKRGTHTWNKRGQIISIDNGVYDALSTWYKELYNSVPTHLDRQHYEDFYRKYKGTWLCQKVEETMTQLWQPGRAYDGTTWAGITYGKEFYTALYVSVLAQFDDIYKYVSPHLYFSKYRAGTSYIYLLGTFKSMGEISRQTDTAWLWNAVKRRWLDSLLQPETYEEGNYYEGGKQKLIIEFFNEFGWGLFMADGYQPTEWQRHTATLYGRSCERMTNLASHACELYREGITKYGLNEDAVAQEVVKQDIARQVQSSYWQNKQKGR